MSGGVHHGALASSACMQALLTALHGATRASLAEERLRLADLVALGRKDDSRQELLTSDALDTLAAYVAVAATELTDTLVELLATLACDHSYSVRTRLAERPALLALPLRCLQTLAAKKPSKKRTRTMRIALELTEMLSATDAAKIENHQGQVVVVLVRVLENPQDDESLLLHAVHVLTATMEMRRANIHTAANFNAAAVLLRLLDTSSERMDLKRAVCTALLVVASAPELVSVIAANNAIQSIALCLRLRALNRHVETAALQLLLRLCQESHVYGQVINEELIPVLFQILGRSPTHEVTNAACRVLEGVACFAVGNKLDLSPFMNAGLVCRGSVVVEAVANHSHDVALVACTFRFFGNMLRNPTELAALMNGETLEGLLGMYILYCGSTGNSASELGDLLATLVSRLHRGIVDGITFENEDKSLPALFLCLRSHTADLQFASNVFALVTKHWGSMSLTKSAQALSGFVGIAVELLLLHCGDGGSSSLVQLVNLLYFLRNILLTNDGGDVVLACGGFALSRSLSQHLPKRPGPPTTVVLPSSLGPSASSISLHSGDSSTAINHFQKMGRIVVDMLNRALSSAVTAAEGQDISIREVAGDQHDPHHDSTGSCTKYDRNATLVDRCEQSENESWIAGGMNEQIKQQKSPSNPATCDPSHCASQEAVTNRNDDDEVDDEANDDGSDSDGDEEDGPIIQAEQLQSRDSEGVTVECREKQAHGENSSSRQTAVPTPCHIRNSLSSLHPVDFSKLLDQQYCFVDYDSIRYPKHPSRDHPSHHDATASCNKSDGFALLHEPPAHAEPCRPPDPNAADVFVDAAIRRREQFVASDPQTRARIVYENTAVFTNSKQLRTSCSGIQPLCNVHHPYEVLETSTAFSLVPSLTFDSWFESGNLERVIQIGEFEYDLVLRRDLNTTSHTQWFYFAVSNIGKSEAKSSSGSRYRFNIVNLCKPDSLFNHGLQPVIYSLRDASERHVGWRRAGEDIYYFPNPFLRSPPTIRLTNSGDSKIANPEGEGVPHFETESNTNLVSARTSSSSNYFTLTFTLDLTNIDDTYLIAHSFPYTFSDHQRHLQRILHQHRPSRRRMPQVIKHSVLCTTLEGRPCDLLTISDFSASTQELKARRAIIVTARVHPGEAQASWIMRGVIEFLVGSSEVARVLRRLFVFLVVPMLNPDGVFHGNSRCSLSACDLNRHWHSPSPHLHPTIFHIKELVRNEQSTRGIVFFCDIHGHSRKKNVFMYGCDTKKRPNPRARHFAKLLSTHPTTRRFVSFIDCSFKVSRDKENTARVVLTKELKLSWCFTLEASFGGASFGELQDIHFNTTHLRQVGFGLCETLLPACISDIALRDKIFSLVDDHTVSIASLVDSHMCEAGIVSDGRLGPISQTAQATTPRKDKETLAKHSSKKDPHAPSKLRRRRTVGIPTEDDRKGVISALSQKTSRKSSTRKQSSNVSRRRSSPLAASQIIEGENKTKAMETVAARTPRRGNMPKKKSGEMNPGGKPLLDLMDAFVPPDEEDTQLYKLQALVRGSSSSTSSSSGHSGSLPVTPETPPQSITAVETSPSIPPRRRLTAVSCRNIGDSDTSGATLFRFTNKDAVPIILPPPVGELLLSRSPKPPTKAIRFKGAGRQYAALSPPAKPPSRPTLFMKSESVASTVGYEPELINASTIALKQRTCVHLDVPNDNKTPRHSISSCHVGRNNIL